LDHGSRAIDVFSAYVSAPLGAAKQLLAASKNHSVQWFEVALSNGL
jgi:hypothetical protein